MRLRINVFPGIQNIPNLVADQRGLFAAHGLEVDTVTTRSSQDQRRALADGECDLAHSAIDNALALVDAGVDAVVVMGLDAGFNKLVARPEIAGIGQLSGRVFGVDAPDTAFALLGYEMLRRAGLERDRDYTVRPVGATGLRLEALARGEVDFALLNLPFNLQAEAAGLRLIGDPLDVLDAYQSTGAFVLRSWAAANGEALERYIAAYVQALRWALDPRHQDAMLALLRERLELPAAVAERCYHDTCRSPRGFRPDAPVDPAGVARVVALRDAFSPRPDGSPREAARYLDDTAYRAALTRLKGSQS